MATTPILGRDIYMALAAVGWADGQLTRQGADAIVRTALAEGLELEDIQAIEDATKNRIELGTVDRLGMSKSDRLYVYAVASWIAELDGNVSDEAKEALAKLGDALGVPEAPRTHADSVMKEIAAQADRPERFDLLALRQTLDERLEVAHRLRMEYLAKKREEEEAAKKAEEEEKKKKKAVEEKSPSTKKSAKKSGEKAPVSKKKTGTAKKKSKKKSSKKKAASKSSSA